MVVQTKRKNPIEEDQDAKVNTKKRKQDVAWLTEGIAGTDPFESNNFFVYFGRFWSTATCLKFHQSPGDGEVTARLLFFPRSFEKIYQ